MFQFFKNLIMLFILLTRKNGIAEILGSKNAGDQNPIGNSGLVLNEKDAQNQKIGGAVIINEKVYEELNFKAEGLFLGIFLFVLLLIWTLLFYYLGQYAGWTSCQNVGNDIIIELNNKIGVLEKDHLGEIEKTYSNLKNDIVLFALNNETDILLHKNVDGLTINKKWLKFLNIWIEKKGEHLTYKGLSPLFEELKKNE